MSDIRFNRWLHQSGTGGVYQDGTGSVGIGTSVPTSLVDIQGGSLKIGNHTLSSSSSSLNINGNVSIGGTLTYEDVTNIDSVGIITAQSGIHVTGVGSSVGIGTDNPSSRLQILDIDGTTTITGSRGSGHSYKFETTGLNAEGFNIIDVDNAQRAWLYYAGSNPSTDSYHSFNTNGTERVKILSDGVIKTTNHAECQAYDTAKSIEGGDGSDHELGVDTFAFNRGGYTISNNRLVVPHAGRYRVWLTTEGAISNSAYSIRAMRSLPKINGTTISHYASLWHSAMPGPSSNTHWTFSDVFYLTLQANDALSINFQWYPYATRTESLASVISCFYIG